jgi:hypothetical protein
LRECEHDDVVADDLIRQRERPDLGAAWISKFVALVRARGDGCCPVSGQEAKRRRDVDSTSIRAARSRSERADDSDAGATRDAMACDLRARDEVRAKNLIAPSPRAAERSLRRPKLAC